MFVKLTGDKFDPNDPTNYSDRNFYTLETGRENIQVRVSDRVSRTIKNMVNNPALQHYQTQSDFVRDAIMHRLHDLTRLVMDREMIRELEDLFANEANLQQIHEWKRQQELLRTATQDAIDLLRQNIEMKRALPPEQDTSFHLLLNKNRHHLHPDQEAELRLLLLYFAQYPADIREEVRHPEDWEIERWRMRQTFWKDDDYIPQMDYERAKKLGLME